MDKIIKLHTTDGMIRSMRLGKLKQITPPRELIVEKSRDNYDRVKITFTRSKLMIHDNSRLKEFEELIEIITPQIISDRKLKGAFSNDGINLYSGSYLVYSFDSNGKMLVNNEDKTNV